MIGHVANELRHHKFREDRMGNTIDITKKDDSDFQHCVRCLVNIVYPTVRRG